MKPALRAKLDSMVGRLEELNHLLASPEDAGWPERVPAMIRAHMALRRA